MPYIDGIEAIKQIRASTDPEIAATPIVALNSLAMSGDRERFMAAGANAYLSKPFTVRSLLSIVRELLLGAKPAQ
ncbi:MAG: response regulator [Anaerolineales bacterium]|nr:response regulator [Anaerolineales bacterium]